MKNATDFSMGRRTRITRHYLFHIRVTTGTSRNALLVITHKRIDLNFGKISQRPTTYSTIYVVLLQTRVGRR